MDLNELIDRTHCDYEQNETKAKQLEEKFCKSLESLKVIFLRDNMGKNLEETKM